MDPFWLVWNPQGGPPEYRHPTFDSAKQEAERLAAAHPGQAFIVLCTVGLARKVESLWTDIAIPELPF